MNLKPCVHGRLAQAARISVALAALGGGCNFAPRAERPAVEVPPAFKEQTATNLWSLAQPSDDVRRGAWWVAFNDPLLNELEARVAVSNQNVAAALASVMAARALVREARAICASGRLGEIRKIAVEYLQGWLSTPLERTGQKQAAWRSDPALNGPGGCIGDIGVHAFHLLEYVTGLDVTSINATLRNAKCRKGYFLPHEEMLCAWLGAFAGLTPDGERAVRQRLRDKASRALPGVPLTYVTRSTKPESRPLLTLPSLAYFQRRMCGPAVKVKPTWLQAVNPLMLF